MRGVILDRTGELLVGSEQPHSFVRVLRDRKWIVILTVVIAVAAASAYTLVRTPLYRTTATMTRDNGSLQQSVLNSTPLSSEDVQRDLVTTSKQLTTLKVAERVKQQLNSSRSAGSLLLMVSATAASDSSDISVSAVSTNPKEAAAVANAFVTQTIALLQETNRQTIVATRKALESQLAAMTAQQRASDNGVSISLKIDQLDTLEQLQSGGYVLWEPAGVPSHSFSPQPTRDIGAALVLGLILGVLFAYALDRYDKRIKRESDFEEIFGLPVLASVPRVGKKKLSRDPDNVTGFVGFKDSASVLLESYRTLRSNLQYFDVDKETRKLLIVSGLPQEGKTATAVNLAISLALSGKKVILVDTDLRSPMMHRYLGIGNDVGLSSVLAGIVRPTDALQTVRLEKFIPRGKADFKSGNRGENGEADTLHRDFLCLASGPLPPNPAELLASPKMAEVIAAFGALADYVLLDAAPVLLVADALAVAPHVDGTLVAARNNTTTSDEARETRQLLDRVGARLIGVVVSGVRNEKGHGYRYGYYSPDADSSL